MVIWHVMAGGFQPEGGQVFAFTNPSTMELEDDFLRRTWCECIDS